MEANSPRKIQFTVPLLEPHLDPEAAEQIRRRRPTPATLVLSSDQSSPEIDEERVPNPLQKSLSMSPHQRKKMSRTTPTMKELQLLAEHHLCKQGSEEEKIPHLQNNLDDRPDLGCCCHGNTASTQESHIPCSCFTQDGQQENNSLGRRHASQEDSLDSLVSDGNTQTCEPKKQSSRIAFIEDK
ncbi:protein phosphatase 1 regulatory subunit 1A isoform X1 [Xenopus tropicalis]|uniref:Protein phosphatase 1 regulatory subunit 1A n=1 Tax=Xenopus tropicalis TaxID=8364 RepID=A0A8J1J458_XENTR|nr:protein phosphatase 1 regulatory subunit 1A isoform X1 [Xenopus tropicalis]